MLNVIDLLFLRNAMAMRRLPRPVGRRGSPAWVGRA